MGRITVRVHPGAKRRRIIGRLGAEWKIAVTAPPADGKANQACVELLAEACRVRQSRVALTSGASSRRKVFDIDGLGVEQIHSFMAAAAGR